MQNTTKILNTKDWSRLIKIQICSTSTSTTKYYFFEYF